MLQYVSAGLAQKHAAGYQLSVTYLLGLVAKVDPVIGTVSAAVLLLSWLTATRTRALMRVLKGKSEQRYVRWFLDQYSTYQNPYLDASEPLQLDRTYIPLSFVDSDRDGNERDLADLPVATATIADPSAGNIIIVGDAGSGKTTTLKAFGVATLQGRRRGAIVTPVGRDRREVPFFVSMRALAASLRRRVGLAEYLKTDVLGARVGLSIDEARDLLARLLEQRRCVVLLDGLDEIAKDDYHLVYDEVMRFTGGHQPEQPTANARLVISCRRHNFLRIRDDWLSAPNKVAKRVYALAPLRDTEIVGYLHKLRDRFRRSDGPEYFMIAVRASNTLHLHRVPLVLAMSVGLFARREAFEIPSSIAELYDTMIKEMLDRHRKDGPVATVKFLRDDKLRVLREFSLNTARNVGFETFTRESLSAFTQELRPKLLDLREGQVDAFVDEIIDRSGLLSPASDNTYEFAHRSIQDHLVAAELLREDTAVEGERASGGGRKELFRRATNRDWHQVVLFYTAAADQSVVSPFLADLATLNDVEAVVLAGSCLAGANCLDDVGFRILDELAAMLRTGKGSTLLSALDAMLSATTSPRLTVRTRAADLVHKCLTHVVSDTDAVAALGGNTDGVLGVITMLVDRAGPIGIRPVLVSRLAAVVPDDPRLVQPLWRSLVDPHRNQYEANNVTEQHLDRIAERLLTLATDPACFQELQCQPAPQEPPFITVDLRQKVYPFRRGLDPSSNFVTLLCWADQRGVTLPEPNRFLEAMVADRAAWARVEADRNRTAYTIRLPGFPVLHKRSRHPLVKFVGLGLTILTLTVTVATIVDMYRDDAALDLLGHLATLVVAVTELGLSLIMLGVRVHIGPSRLLQLWQTNPYVDVYDDPRSRHWLDAPQVES